MKKSFILNKKQLYCVTFLLFVIGIIFEFVFKEKEVIIVDGNYIYSIYASIVAISTLCVTVLTIIINSLSTKYYGFYLKEIINFKSCYFRISCAIPFVIVQVLLSSFFLAINLINLVCAILVIIAIFIINLSVYIWYIVTDYDFSKNLTIDYIKSSITNSSEVIPKLFLGANYYIEQNDLDELSNCIDIIIKKQNSIGIDKDGDKVSKRETNSNNLSIISIDDYIKESFIFAEKQYGLIVAIEQILIIYSKTNLTQNKTITMIYEIIERYQFVSDLEIHSNEIVNVVNSLYKIDTNLIDDGYKSIIIYRIFCYIYENEIISDGLRKTLLNSIITKLMANDVDIKNNYYFVKQKALLYIFQNFILLNSNHDYGNYLMGKLSLALYNKTMFGYKKAFETIAIIYLVLYIYSNYEKDNICTTQIEYIEKLIDISDSTINEKNIIFKSIIAENFNSIVISLLEIDNKIFTNFSFLEYFPKGIVASSKIPSFTERALIDFTIYNYFLNWQEFDIDIEKSNFGELHKTQINSILDMFDPNSKIFTQQTKHKIEDLSLWIDIGANLDEKLEIEFYEKVLSINSQIKISELDLIKPHKFDAKLLNDKLNKEFEKNNFYGYSPAQTTFLQENEYKFNIIITTKDFPSEFELAQHLFLFYKNEINKSINRILNEERISFDEEGIKKLFDKLNLDKFNNTNTNYINDLAFDKNVFKSDLFKHLKEKLKKLNMVKTSGINSKVYFIDNALNFDIKIIGCEDIELSQMEVSKYLERFKISDNIFNVDGAYVDRNKAITYINNIYSKILITYIFKSNLRANSGFRINFVYKRHKHS